MTEEEQDYIMSLMFKYPLRECKFANHENGSNEIFHFIEDKEKGQRVFFRGVRQVDHTVPNPFAGPDVWFEPIEANDLIS